MKQLLCQDCDQHLGNDEVALNLKLRDRSIGRFYCIGCLAKHLDCEEAELRDIAGFFREHNCELFTHQYVNEQGSDQL